MKYAMVAIIISIIFFSDHSAQNKFSIGFCGGLVFPEAPGYSTGKVGAGYNLSFNYKLTNNIKPYITFGKFVFGKSTNLLNNASIYEISLGSRYFYVLNRNFSIFLLLEGRYNSGEMVDERYNSMSIPLAERERIFKSTHKEDISSFGISSGLGINHKITDIISISLHYTLGLYNDNTDVYNGKLFLGFEYSL